MWVPSNSVDIDKEGRTMKKKIRNRPASGEIITSHGVKFS
jgi:hypothetical protein